MAPLNFTTLSYKQNTWYFQENFTNHILSGTKGGEIMDHKEFHKAFRKIVGKAWNDETFKAKLHADPVTVLKENGIEVPTGMAAKIVENTDKVAHYVLRPQPAEELSEEVLEKACPLCGKIAPRTWTDEAFKADLLAAPAAVLDEHGIEMPEGVYVKMVENTEEIVHFILPAPPEKGELSEEDLENAVGGAT